MKTATVAETQDHLSDLIEDVKGGETVLIVEQGSPVARLVPPVEAAPAQSDEEILARLESKGLVRRGRGGLAPEILAPPPRAASGVSILEVLLEERREGR